MWKRNKTPLQRYVAKLEKQVSDLEESSLLERAAVYTAMIGMIATTGFVVHKYSSVALEAVTLVASYGGIKISNGTPNREEKLRQKRMLLGEAKQWNAFIGNLAQRSTGV